MDIKTQILKEAEKRYPVDANGFNSHESSIFIAGTEWLDTEIVQPLRKENEGLKERISGLKEAVVFFGANHDTLQSQLSLSEGRVKELEAKLKSYRAYEDNIDQALNSGDGVYRP